MRDVVCSGGAVVTADKYAAEAGADVLRRGGNAVDAAVAAMLVECVVQPHNVALGGYAGTMVMYSAGEGKATALDFDGAAPLASTPDMFLNEPEGANDRGPLCVVAPPIVAGLNAALERWGTMSFAEVAEAAQKMAEEGFPVYKQLAVALRQFVEHADKDNLRALLPNRKAPNEGDLFIQKDMAALISRLRRDGPTSFYKGDIPRAIASAIKKKGGILAEADFDAVTPRFEDPLSIQIGDYEVFTPGIPAGGLTALQVLKVMAHANIPASDLQSARYYHLMIEAAKHAWCDRHQWFGDPLSVDVPIRRLLSDEHALDLWRKIEDEEPIAGETATAAGGHTVHLVTADKDGSMVSLTSTQGAWMGSYVAIEGFGLLLGNGMSRFEREPGHPNSIAPGKRMQHNMSPLLITRGGKAYCAIGLPGGRKIVNVAALLAQAITRFGATCGEAIALPRFHLEGPEPALVDSAELVAEIKQEFGADYPVSTASATLGGPVAGIMLAPDGNLLAASQNGPECVKGIITN